MTIDEARETARSLRSTRRQCSRRRSPARVRSTRSTSARSFRTSTGRLSSTYGVCGAGTRRSSRTVCSAMPPARCSRTGSGCSTASSPSSGSPRRRWWGSGRPIANGDDIVLASAGAEVFDRRLHGLRQQLRRHGKPNLSIGDFVAPANADVRDHVGAFAVTVGPEEIAIARTLRGRPRRLLVDHGQGVGGPHRRGACRIDARPGAARAVGVRAQRVVHAAGADRRAVPRHRRCPAIRRNQTTARRSRSSNCSTPSD